jgi:hypothetical protein
MAAIGGKLNGGVELWASPAITKTDKTWVKFSPAAAHPDRNSDYPRQEQKTNAMNVFYHGRNQSCAWGI